MTVLSKGEEQPVCQEESEACWQQNRRGHFVVTAR
jgi:outer membrane protein OmpA-like peptidoglycan-associated protein